MTTENMTITKRDGSEELINISKIVKAINKHAQDLPRVDATAVAIRTIGGLYNGATTREIDLLAIQTSSHLISEEPDYSKLAARLLCTFITKEVSGQDIHSFSQSIAVGYKEGLVSEETYNFVNKHARKLNDSIDNSRSNEFEFFGLQTVYDRYLLRHPKTRQIIETPQQMFLRVSCGIAQDVNEAIEFYELISKFMYLPASPTLFNSGTVRPQLSSCYLLDSPEDDLAAIYNQYRDVALLSKYAGGIGLAYSRVRSRGSHIQGTNGQSNGIVPWLHTLDASVISVNQCVSTKTLYYTNKGMVPHERMTTEHAVLGKSGTYRQVEEIYNYLGGDDPMLALRLAGHPTELEIKAGHPVFTQRGWIEAGELTTDDLVGYPIPKEVIDRESMDLDDAFFLGTFLSVARYDAGLMGKQTPHSWYKMRFTLDGENSPFQLWLEDYLKRRNAHISSFKSYTESAAGARIIMAEIEPEKFGFSLDEIGNATYEGALPLRNLPITLAHLPLDKTAAMLKGVFLALDADPQEYSKFFPEGSLLHTIIYQLIRLGWKYELMATPARSPQVKTKDRYTLKLVIPQPIIGAREDFAWTPITAIRSISSPNFVGDLKVEGDESYTTIGGLIHNGGRRPGSACVYLEPWHSDIEEFLELRNNTGDALARTHNLNLANWIPDLFMKRVEQDEMWSLFDPKVVPDFPDLWGENFDFAYIQAESEHLYTKQLPARELYGKMMATLAQTGNGWMTFKDISNRTSNQTLHASIQRSNLCTEILEVTRAGEVAVCNLASINLGRFVRDETFDFEELRRVAKIAIRQLDNVIDRNFYPIPQAEKSNKYWRPVGLGVMGLQDVFFKMRIPFDSEAAMLLSNSIAEVIYYAALEASVELAKRDGVCPAFRETRTSMGTLQFDLHATPVPQHFIESSKWDELRTEIKTHGLRNSLLIAIAPTATIASIAGAYESIEPQTSNFFKRATLSGDFVQINKYLVRDLQALDLWTPEIREQIKAADGSIQGLDIPQDIKDLYKTAWDLSMKTLIALQVGRGRFIDQAVSLNLFMANPTIGSLSSLYMHAWKEGIKTTYYLRSRAATRVASTTSLLQAVVCSLADPESCEACQ